MINFQHVKEEERIKTVEAAIAEAEAMQGGNAGWLQKGFRRSSNQTGLTISLSSDPESHPTVGFESVSGFGFRVSGFGFRRLKPTFAVGFGFRVSGFVA